MQCTYCSINKWLRWLSLKSKGMQIVSRSPSKSTISLLDFEEYIDPTKHHCSSHFKNTHTHTPPKFNSSPLKNDAWNTKLLSFWVLETFQGRTVKLRGCIMYGRQVNLQIPMIRTGWPRSRTIGTSLDVLGWTLAWLATSWKRDLESKIKNMFVPNMMMLLLLLLMLLLLLLLMLLLLLLMLLLLLLVVVAWATRAVWTCRTHQCLIQSLAQNTLKYHRTSVVESQSTNTSLPRTNKKKNDQKKRVVFYLADKPLSLIGEKYDYLFKSDTE